MVWREGNSLNRPARGMGRLKIFFLLSRRNGGRLKRGPQELAGIVSIGSMQVTKMEVLFLNAMIFVVSLCIVALGVLISHILEQRIAARKNQGS